MGRQRNSRIILIDADVLAHFISGGQLPLLPKIFPFPIKILDKVYAELKRMPGRKREVDNLLVFKFVELIPFPEDNPQVKREYHYLKKMFKGDGESACLALVRYSRDILASSNLKETASYCQLHQLDYLTTMDFLCQAVENRQLLEQDCDNFIRQVLEAGSKLPVKSWSEFVCRKIRL